jgi:hypothetical protein
MVIFCLRSPSSEEISTRPTYSEQDLWFEVCGNRVVLMTLSDEVLDMRPSHLECLNPPSSEREIFESLLVRECKLWGPFKTRSRVPCLEQVNMISDSVSHTSLILDLLVLRGCIWHIMDGNWWSKAMMFRSQSLKQTKVHKHFQVKELP